MAGRGESSMRITVASGKGGTGKTTVATSLALSLGAGPHGPPRLLDCDVEAPNARFFLHPIFNETCDAVNQIPKVDETKCTHCGTCADVCQYHAIVVIGSKTLVFPQLCHGCGSCTLTCPEGAISEIPTSLGKLSQGPANDGVDFGQGLLNIGEPMAVPVIKQLKSWKAVGPDRVEILDAPPGTSCPVVETMRDADYLLLVTEPTPFGLHDLRLAVEVAKQLGIPAGVIINRDGMGNNGVDVFCQDAGIPVLMRIPFEREIAEGVARGYPLVEIHPEYVAVFQALFARISRET